MNTAIKLCVGVTILVASVAPARATDVYLVARAFNKQVRLPDGTLSAPIPMWGFALDADNDLSTIGAEVPTAPGPALNVTDGTLVIHLRNDLTEGVSVVIPELPAALAPVRNAAGRVVSFTAPTPPGAVGTYTWTNVRPGTFLYQSGTHPAVQVQMGLYGAVTSTAYPGVASQSEVLLVWSEIDPELHAAVAGGNYGPGRLVTSTVHYKPRYFLLNGEAFWPGRTPLPAGIAGTRTWVRLVNAGLRSHVPVVNGGTLELVAEDGQPYPYVRRQSAALLAAGKTLDAIWVPPSVGRFALFDRALHLNSAGRQGGGMLVSLDARAP
jgi:FtsP/CotA-like multicopper oxidase with cupredoxin domain